MTFKIKITQEPALSNGGHSCFFWGQHLIWMPVHVPNVRLLIQFLAKGLGKAKAYVPSAWAAAPTWEAQRSYGLLASTRQCSHLGSISLDGLSLFLYLSLCFSLTLLFKSINFLTTKIIKCYVMKNINSFPYSCGVELVSNIVILIKKL